MLYLAVCFQADLSWEKSHLLCFAAAEQSGKAQDSRYDFSPNSARSVPGVTVGGEVAATQEMPQ